MAEGRMLKRAVSESRRLAELKTDSARLLWTWILPYLDIQGRYVADPDLIRGKIVPRLKSFTPRFVAECLEDMYRVGLIILYEIDGERYLQFRNFHEFQNLREDREGKSKIPAPPDNLDNSMSTTGVVQEYSMNTPIEYNISKDNISKGKKVKENSMSTTGVKTKKTYLDCVELTTEEFDKLKLKYGEHGTEKAIEVLNNYKMKSGKKYKSDYHALLEDWVQEKINGKSQGYIRQGNRGQEVRELPREVEDGIRRAQKLEQEWLAKQDAKKSTIDSNISDS